MKCQKYAQSHCRVLMYRSTFSENVFIDLRADFCVIVWKSATVREIAGNTLSPILVTKMFVYSVDFHQYLCLDPLKLDLLKRPVVAANKTVNW